MIDTEERRAELRMAYDTLVAFNLWRRGYIEAKEASDPKEIGDALDTACGLMWEFVNVGKPHGEKEFEAALRHNDQLKEQLEIAKNALNSSEAENAELRDEIKKLEYHEKMLKCHIAVQSNLAAEKGVYFCDDELQKRVREMVKANFKDSEDGDVDKNM